MFDACQLWGSIWWLLIVIGVPHCGWGLSTPFTMIEWMTHFSILSVFFLIFWQVFPSIHSLLKSFNVSQFQRPSSDCLNDIEVCHSERADLGPWNIGEWKSISQYCRSYSNILVLFSDSVNFFQILLVFSSSRDQMLVF